MVKKRCNVSIAPELYTKLCECMVVLQLNNSKKKRVSLYDASKVLGNTINIKELKII